MKNDPHGSCHQRVDKSPKPFLKPEQPAQDPAVSSGRKAHKNLKAQLGRVHMNILPNQNDLQNKQQSQSLKIHHHQAV